MLTSNEIKEKAERSYKDFLTTVVRKEIFFPHHIKGNKGNADAPLQHLFPALKHLIDHSKEKIGYGYTLTFKEVNTRQSGVITMPDEIFFENLPDYLKFIEKEKDFLAFRKAIDQTKSQIPTLLQWIENNPLKCQKHTSDWSDILKLVQYFIKNHPPHPYWRQLPIEANLSTLETLQPLLTELLTHALPPTAFNALATTFEPRFGLRYDEPIIRIRFLDENISRFQIGRAHV